MACAEDAGKTEFSAPYSFRRALNIYLARFRDGASGAQANLLYAVDHTVSGATLIGIFKEWARLTDKEGLFSANEELDDVSTRHLPYLLIPFVLGELYCRGDVAPPGDLRQRVESYNEGLLYFAQFIAHMRSLGLRTDDQDVAPADFNKAASRDEKLRLLARQRELEGKIHHLMNLAKKHGNNPQQAGGAEAASHHPSASEFADEFCFLDAEPGVDEERVRQLFLLLLARSELEAQAKSSLVRRERDMLEPILRSTPCTAGEQKPCSPPAPTPMKPYIFHIQNMQDVTKLRAEYRDRVFTPFHHLPTVSLAEVAEWEMNMEVNVIGGGSVANGPRAGNLESKRGVSGGRAAESNEPEESVSSESETSEAEEKARKWDDWKDMNERGGGNKNVNRG